MIRLLPVAVFLCSQVVSVLAQLDDLAGDDWAAPVIDVVEQLRSQPLCLPCATAVSLTIIPGINRSTASRITQSVKNGIIDLDELCNQACLSEDQRTLLFLCTTFHCSCEPFITGIHHTTRALRSTGSDADVLTRIDVASAYGRAGGIIRQQQTSTLSSGWVVADIGAVSIAAGRLAVAGGLGLVIGSGSTFGSSVISKASGYSIQPRIRPWSSSITDGALTGVALKGTVEAGTVGFHAVAAYSRQTLGDRTESILASGIVSNFMNNALGVFVQHARYTAPSTSTSMRIIPQCQRTIASAVMSVTDSRYSIAAELAADDSLRLAMMVIAGIPVKSGEVLLCARYAHPDIRNPYASPVSTLSALGNEAGIALGYRYSSGKGLAAETMVDVYRILAPSYSRPMPSAGVTLLTDIMYRLGKGFQASVRIRYNGSDEGWRPDFTSRRLMHTARRFTTRWQLGANLTEQLRFIVRCEYQHLSFSGGRYPQTGLAGFAETVYHLAERLRMSLRTTVFRSQTISVAPYMLEYPLPGLPRTVAATGSGSRVLLSLRYSMLPWLTLSAAFWDTYKLGQPTTFTTGLQAEVFYLNKR